ncbi:MAG TPA: protein phosphatase 2C domain-containing protein [Polyangiaceae bacterium]|jgi:serine/threonine protein phosphatase PrpC
MPVHVTVVAQTEVGLVRQTNEDAFVIADLSGGSLLDEQKMSKFEVGQRGVLLAVSDGMGGHQAGEVASALVVESLQRSMAQLPSLVPSDALLEKAAQRANRDVWKAAHFPGRERMGATLTAVYIQGTTAHIAEVGDSRAYLVRSGKIKQVTRDQSYVQLMVDTGAMSPAQAKTSELSSVILQAMGLKETVQIALGRLDLRQRDCFLLCSDGLSSLVDDEEIRNLVLTAGPLDAVCSRLVDLAMKRGGTDNITVIAAGVGGDLPALVAGESISDTLLVVQDFQARPSSA